MRHIGALLLVFLVIAVPACGPHLPSLDMASQPGDGGADRYAAAASDVHLRATPPDATTMADGAAPETRPDTGPSEARPDTGTAEARPDAFAAEARPEVAAPEVRPDATPLETRPDVGAPETGMDAVAEVRLEVSPEAPLPRAARVGEIRIDEVLIDPDGNDLGHEWFEIVNVTGDPLSLADLHVADGATDVAVEGGVLAAGARLVLGQSVDRAHNGDAPVDVSYGTKLALNNDADRIAVCLGACAGAVVLDAFQWTEAWGPAFVGHAVVIEPSTGVTCAAPTPYGSAGNFGTPGTINPPCEMPKLPR